LLNIIIAREKLLRLPGQQTQSLCVLLILSSP
jgi:hypothetical protein